MTSAQFIEVLVTAAAPISELRGAIPLGLTFTDNWGLVVLIAFIGNLLPVPFILLFLGPVTDFLSKISIFEKIINFIFRISRRRGRIVERYGAIGLTLFVAVPLPITGAWTGSIVAFLLGMKFRKAFPAIVLGVLLAGIIVTSVAVVLDYSFFRD